MSDMEAQEHFDEFFEEVFTELEDKVSIRAIPEEKNGGEVKGRNSPKVLVQVFSQDSEIGYPKYTRI